jgi:putative ABC transport system substrate-binding protein
MRRVGILMGSIDNPEMRPRVPVLLTELQKLGWIDGSTVSIDLRWGGSDPIAEACELIRLKPDVVVAGPTDAYLPVQRQTQSIPIIFVSVSDPLGQGFVKSLSRPEGNATGFSNLEFSLLGKWVQLLKEAVRSLKRVGLLISTSNASSPRWHQAFGEVAPTFNIEPLPLPLENADQLEHLVARVASEARSALIVPGDSIVEVPGNRRQILALAAKHRLPALYGLTALPRKADS